MTTNYNNLKTVAAILTENGKTLALAESCTGGLLGAKFTELSGATAFFLGGVISYANEVKESHLNVNIKTINTHGAVSMDTAEEMSKGVLMSFKSDYAISITGIAGPGGGTPDKPVGLAYISVSSKSKTFAKKFNLEGSRKEVREQACAEAVKMLLKELR